MPSLFAAVRKACPSGIWSQGVKLAREGAVSVESQRDDEVTLRVRVPRRAVPPTVVLYPNDDEWTCDCGSKIDPCEHIAAAAIALQQGEGQGEARAEASLGAPASVPKAAPKAHVGYRLVRQDKSLYLSRAIVHDDGREEPLRGPLSSVVAKGGPLLPTHDDLAFDRVVGPQPRVFLPTVRMPELLALLASAGDVTLDSEKVVTRGDRVLPRAVVRDADDGVVLRIERAPEIEAVVARGVVRVAGVLRPMGEVELTGDLLDKLPRVRPFPVARFPELVTEVLPALEEKLPVVVESKRLPKRARAVKPRVVLELSQPLRGDQDAALSVIPFIVYGDPPQARIDDGRLVHLGGEIPVRDEGAEKRLLQRVRDELDLVPGRRVELLGRDALRFASRLKAWAVHDPEQTILASQPLSPRIEADGDRFEVTFETEGGQRRASSAAAVRAWEEGLDIVPLDGGGWAPLPLDWLQKHGRRLADLLAARDEEGRVPKSAATLVARVCEALEQPPPPSFAGLASALDHFERIPEAKLPDDLRAELRAYQRTGVSWLCFLRDAGLGAVLADDMGLGKTLQTIAALRGRTLVVAPRSVVHNWAAEIAKFRPGLRTSLYHGPRRALDPSADVTITTYAVLRLDLDSLAKQEWDVVVLDEAQAIKNADSQAARAAFELHATFCVALSGTPVENRLDELWSIFHFANRGLLGGRSDFKERYASPIAAGEASAAERLRERIRPFLLRRLKKEVAPELPPRTDIVLRIELEEPERAVYDAVRAATKKEVLDRLAEGGSVLAALEALLRLRQAACHPQLVPGQRADTSSKVDTLVEALEDAASEGHKALVFSQWTSMLDLIEPHLGDIPFVRLDGSTADRAGVVAKFQADDGPPVMLVSLRAGGTGLNLTAADHVFLVDPWWNPAVEDQAADRAHRIGQDKPVFVHRLVAKDTVEEGILALQEKKRAIADAALAAGNHAGGITRDELLALLS
ncbi:MAG: DEAD/DEAH box helicase [Deltaproteobacteria bacterium]|nr:DEAD/DEAH box helicase [Deltaproteobacteria bacterium]